MSDNWDNFNHTEPTPSQEPTVTPDPAPAAVPTPVQEPAAPATESAPSAPQTPPVNSWSSDGSYRYVPPRQQQDTPPAAPSYQNPYYQQPRYQSPASQGQTPPVGTGYQSPVGGYTPPTPAPQQPPKKGNGWIAVIAVLGALAVIASVVLISFGAAQFIGGDGEVGGSTVVGGDNAPQVNENAPTLEIDTWDTNDGGLSTEEIVKRNYDSTVVLTAYSQSNNFYFGESNLTEVAGATGIVMQEDGYIITNRHCVINEQTGKKYDRIDVTTYNGTIYENATVIGADEATDLAVIKVEATDLTPAQFGDSDELEVGARVVALGNAAGLSWTATQGIVSAKARDVYDDTGYAIKCLQVDVAINSGNSGGPLMNKQGLVVGINSAKIAASGYEGLGFSIPINEAKVVIDSLLKNGYVKGRVALGITGQTISSGMYKGFMIASIGDNSCLKGTDARVQDLIVEVDGVSVIDYGSLRSELAKHQVGDKVKLKLLRSDSRTGQVNSLYVTVTLKEQTAE